MRRITISILKYALFIFLSLLLALFIRVFLCNFYIVPSDSMEPGIISGDFILADKWTYGGRIFTSLKFDRNSDPPMKRVPGFRKIQRNDVVVFNFPYRYEWDIIRMNFEKIFVKRCIGLPGDSVSVIEGFYHVSGVIDTLGYLPEQKRLADYHGDLPPSIEQTFPHDTAFNWNVRNFGPLFIPSAGATIRLTLANLKLYNHQIVYETNSTIRTSGQAVYLNDTLATYYTFRSNWYFVAGDKVLDSQDSRYIGLIPEAFIIGRASMVISSKDTYTGKRQWRRMFKQIN